MKRASRGFTLPEMLVVLAIISIVTAVTITSQSSFDRTIILANTAYDLGVTIRYAQTYGIGSRAAGLPLNTGYGIYFNRGAPHSFIFFADTDPLVTDPTWTFRRCHTPSVVSLGAASPDAYPGDCIYSSGADTLLTTYTFGNNITISDFCVTEGGSTHCANSGDTSLSALGIVFSRPNPDAYFSDSSTWLSSASSACIALTSSNGGHRYVAVNQTGEIQANAAPCI